MEKGKAERLIGSVRGDRHGPLVVAVAGMHGNEIAGIPASQRVLERLARETSGLCGALIALAGNLTALSLGQRYADEDLNRIWQVPRVEGTDAGGVHGSREAAEQAGLLAAVRQALSGAGPEVSFLDLHTTSAPGAPFAVLTDTAENRHLARPLPGTTVLGLDTHLDGTFLNYISSLGFPAVGFEGGHHDDPLSADAHEVAIWETLTLMGCIERPPVPHFDELLERLVVRTEDSPDLVEIVYRHEVTPADGFVMEPGFENLECVRAGQLLARDRGGDIRACRDARILMPLYQDQGNDGFFLATDRQPG